MIEVELKSVLASGGVPDWVELKGTVSRLENMFKAKQKAIETIAKATDRADPNIKSKDKFRQVMEPVFKQTKTVIARMSREHKQCAMELQELVEYFDSGMREKVPLPKNTQKYFATFRLFLQDLLKK